MITAAVKTTPFSEILADYVICESCGFLWRVDRASQLEEACPICNAGAARTRLYFPTAVYTLVDLMQNFYLDAGERENHILSVVLSFCSFTELLMQNFLMNRMMRLRIPHEIRERILADYPYMSDRREKLFPILTGRKWRDALNHLEPDQTTGFLALDESYQRLSRTKNLFLHRGNKSTLSPEMTLEAVHNIPGMLKLFTTLHQAYVFKAPGEVISSG